MSKAINSPTGRLLRNSRLFSLPPPLPPAQLDNLSAAGTLRLSETATQPYPIRQAIATPKSSRHRGDWGLKRPLPRKSTSSSTPHLRIKAIDNDAHITNFESAADHTQNLAKWQEMNIVMSGSSKALRVAFNDKSLPVSAFDDSLDNTIHVNHLAQNEFTDINKLHTGPELAMMRHNLPEERTRWKSKGPALTGMTEDEFQVYLEQLKRPKYREGFREFLKQVKMQQKRKNEEGRVQQETGLDHEDIARIEAASRLQEGELDGFVKQLREEKVTLSSGMSRLLREYLDLPGFVSQETKPDVSQQMEVGLLGEMEEKLGAQPPPVTHPSGGLSYTRTKAYLENHPIWGPQAQHTPVYARVVRPRNHGGVSDKPIFGVGGFVTAEPGNGSDFKSTSGNVDPTAHLQDIDGGSKIWVKADHAYMDKEGRVQIALEKAPSRAVEVKTGNIHPSKNDDPLDGANFRPNQAPFGTRENASYGRALPGTPGQSYRARTDVGSFDGAKYAAYRPTANSSGTQDSRSALQALLADVHKNE